MPRPKKLAPPVSEAVQDLLRAVTSLVTSVQASVASSPAVRASAREVAQASASAKAKSAKLRKALKAYWSNLKGKARKQRVAAILKGRGLKP